LVNLLPLTEEEDLHLLKVMVSAHQEKTDSTIAKRLLENWDKELENFVKVIPHEMEKLTQETADEAATEQQQKNKEHSEKK